MDKLYIIISSFGIIIFFIHFSIALIELFCEYNDQKLYFMAFKSRILAMILGAILFFGSIVVNYLIKIEGLLK